jgi:hypothetical protein
MKTSNTLRIGLLAIATASLVACGGGGGGSSIASTAGFDSTEFQGTWKRNDGTASGTQSNCFNFSDFGGNYGGLNRPVVVTATTITSTIEVYSDTTCTTYLGLLERNYSVTWSAIALAGKTNAARAVVTSTGFSIKRDGAAGYTLTSVPPTGVTSKNLFDVDGTLLYLGSSSAPKDADGYPTALQATALYTR